MTTIAFAGAGRISGVHGLAAKAAGLEITAVASRTEDRAGERAEQMGARACTYDELPAGAAVVLVCTPPARHVDDAVGALQGGAAVIVEKPLATTLADADRLVTAASAHPGRVAYAENLAYAPVVRAALARRPGIGAIHHLDVRVESPAPAWGDFLTEGWGGGVCFDVGPHPLAVAMLLARPARPTAVSARLERRAGHPVDDLADLTITFDSGLHASVHLAWRPGEAHEWGLQAASAGGVLRLELAPDLLLEVDGAPVPVPAPRRDLPDPRLEQMGYTGQVEAFLADFAAGREPVTNAAFGREVLEVIAAAYTSAGDGGRPVGLPFTGPRDRTPLQLWLDA